MASPCRSPISRASARHRSKCSRASPRRPRLRKTLPRFPVASASPCRSPISRASARRPLVVLPRLPEAAEAREDAAQVPRGGGLLLPVPGRASHRERLAEDRPRLVVAGEPAVEDAEGAQRPRAQRRVAVRVGEGVRLLERCALRVAAPEEVEAARHPQQQLAALPPRDETRHGERAVGEAHRGVVEVALLQVIERRVEVAERPLALRALQEVLGEVHAERAVEALRLLGRGAMPALDRGGDRARGTPRAASRAAPRRAPPRPGGGRRRTAVRPSARAGATSRRRRAAAGPGCGRRAAPRRRATGSNSKPAHAATSRRLRSSVARLPTRAKIRSFTVDGTSISAMTFVVAHVPSGFFARNCPSRRPRRISKTKNGLPSDFVAIFPASSSARCSERRRRGAGARGPSRRGAAVGCATRARRGRPARSTRRRSPAAPSRRAGRGVPGRRARATRTARVPPPARSGGRRSGRSSAAAPRATASRGRRPSAASPSSAARRPPARRRRAAAPRTPATSSGVCGSAARIDASSSPRCSR